MLAAGGSVLCPRAMQGWMGLRGCRLEGLGFPETSLGQLQAEREVCVSLSRQLSATPALLLQCHRNSLPPFHRGPLESW